MTPDERDEWLDDHGETMDYYQDDEPEGDEPEYWEPQSLFLDLTRL